MDRVGRGEVDFSGGITAAQDAARGRTGKGGNGPSGGPPSGPGESSSDAGFR